MSETKLMPRNNKYYNIHQWLTRNFDKANKCDNPNCKQVNPKRFEWALAWSKEHEKNRANYIQLCVSCHRKYDSIGSKKGESKNKGEKHGSAKLNVFQVRVIRKTDDLRLIELSKIFNVTPENIKSIIKKESWKHV